METLVVKNFLVIKDASLDVKKFNIIIGDFCSNLNLPFGHI